MGRNNKQMKNLTRIFYDILLKPVGLIRVDTTNDLIAYAPEDAPKST